jgi:L-ascorbate metabolism protein UlaG (beta-lactamase superfamily)
MIRVLPAVCLGALAMSAPVAGPAPAARALELRYVANAGMLVALEGRRFLIDAPTRDGIPPYTTSPAEERHLLESARAPYADVDALLITHWHEDHFSAEAAAAHLTWNPRAIFISSPEVVERFVRAAPDLPAAKVRAVLPDPGESVRVDVSGVPVRVLRIRHNPARRFPEQHLGFLIGESETVLHVGDADPVAENFRPFRHLPSVNLALLPFWYVLDESSRGFVRTSIAPRRIVAMHLPLQDAAATAATLREAGVSVTLAVQPGSAIAPER